MIPKKRKRNKRPVANKKNIKPHLLRTARVTKKKRPAIDCCLAWRNSILRKLFWSVPFRPCRHSSTLRTASSSASPGVEPVRSSWTLSQYHAACRRGNRARTPTNCSWISIWSFSGCSRSRLRSDSSRIARNANGEESRRYDCAVPGCVYLRVRDDVWIWSDCVCVCMIGYKSELWTNCIKIHF